MREQSIGGRLDRYFKITATGSTVRTEVVAGITTFVTMAYIFAVNPSILAESGMDSGAVFTATVVASVVATLIMGLYANLPFGLSAGMGLNAFFSFTVVKAMGHTWQFALTAVLIEGIIFIFLSVFKIREMIVNGIPTVLKHAVSAGIGIFIAFIGLKSTGIIVSDPDNLVRMGRMTTGPVFVCVVGIIVIAGLSIARIRGAILIGIVVATVVGIPFGVTHLNGLVSLPPSMAPTALAFRDFGLREIFSMDMLVVVFTFLFIDLFDTIGTLIGTAAKADMLDERGRLPNAGRALLADAVGTTVGAMMGTSTVTTFVESSAGIAEGGRTGLSAVVTAAFMALSLFFAPFFLLIPPSATAAALIVVGLFMMGSIAAIDFTDYAEGLPAFVTIIIMPLSGSIGDGLMCGIIAYVITNILARRTKEVSVFMIVLAVIFIAKYMMPLFTG
ncbi:MAG: NCS2 family permease [Eubacteriales bacterium]|nr:NCS2 family permease [Eubacteriales bacterium]